MKQWKREGYKVAYTSSAAAAARETTTKHFLVRLIDFEPVECV